ELLAFTLHFGDVRLACRACDCAHELCRNFGSCCFAREYGAEREVLVINGAGGVIILLYHRTLEGQAGKDASRTRVRQHLGIQFPVRSRRRMTSNRACCCRTFAAELELAGKQMLQSLIVHDKHYQVYSLYTDLQTPASTAHRHECWRAPAVRSAARRDASSMLTTENEAAFDQVGNYDHAFGVVQHLFGDPVVRSSHDCVEHACG